MKTLLMIGLGLGLMAGAVTGNGGGYHYGVRFTGDVKPFEPSGVENVAILDEKLDIELKRTGAAVRVRYRMKNMAKKRVKVRFGFPVEVAGATVFDVEKKAGAEEMVRRNCGDYRVVADGKELKAKFLEEKFSKPEQVDYPMLGQVAGIGGWLVSEVTFKAGQERVLEISYVSEYEVAGGSVSDDWAQGPIGFKYRLSTGAVWHGPIRSGVVTVRATGADADLVEMFKPVGKFKRDGGTWTWKFEHLEPTLADDIEIHTEPATEFMGSYTDLPDVPGGLLGYQLQRGVWSLVHCQYEVKASSALASDGKLTYGAENVRGYSYGEDFKAWSEGVEGDGVGEWLEFVPKQELPLMGFKVQPGYGKSDDLFQKNTRPKTISVELNGEHRFEAVLDDRKDGQMVRVKGYAKPVKRMRITIKDVYRGAKYRDTCVSDVVLYSRLKKKPEIQGAR